MKAVNIIAIVLAVAVIAMGVLWWTSYNEKNKLAMQKDSLQANFERATSTINEIQTNLDSIEGGLSGQLFTGGEMPQNASDRRTQIMNTITNMKSQIAADKIRISDLEKRLANSQHKIKGMDELVAKLKASLAAKEQIVAELSGKLGMTQDSLKTERVLSKEEIAKRDKDIADKQTVIAAQEADMNTIFYAYGTRKELITSKIISTTGGLLGIGKVTQLKKSTDFDRYRTFNLKLVDGISFPATKKGYSILSNQNSGSYKVEKVGANNVLKVTNKDLFRRNKILVIEIK
jgi:uncharacterized coiled-coil protein SlyX